MMNRILFERVQHCLGLPSRTLHGGPGQTAPVAPLSAALTAVALLTYMVLLSFRNYGRARANSLWHFAYC